MLRPLGMDVATAESAEQAQAVFQRSPADVVVTDLNFPGASGIDLIRELRKPKTRPRSCSSPAKARWRARSRRSSSVRRDYLQKPLDPCGSCTLVRELLALRQRARGRGRRRLPSRADGLRGHGRRLAGGCARSSRASIAWLGRAPPCSIVGESGTGKELVARAIHNRSRRSQGRSFPVHTGAIPRELIGSELFGHEKGAFTGAFAAAEGKFEAAAGGTVFLDEVGTMDAPTQVSLLRVLETYRFTRVGGRKETRGQRPHRRRHQQAICSISSTTDHSARTSTTGSTSSRLRSRRCASARTTSCRSPSASS